MGRFGEGELAEYVVTPEDLVGPVEQLCWSRALGRVGEEADLARVGVDRERGKKGVWRVCEDWVGRLSCA